MCSSDLDIHHEPTLEEEEMSPTISCNALARINTPQTLKIEVNNQEEKGNNVD